MGHKLYRYYIFITTPLICLTFKLKNDIATIYYQYLWCSAVSRSVNIASSDLDSHEATARYVNPIRFAALSTPWSTLLFTLLKTGNVGVTSGERSHSEVVVTTLAEKPW